MKLIYVLLISVLSFSFCPSIEKVENSTSNGFYIFVQDFTDRTNHKYIVESKDSVNSIFDYFFDSELELGNVDRPITIFNGKRNFYIARVNVFKNAKGGKDFRHLKYPNVYKKRSKLKPVTI
ncbi:hypothetical protein [Aquipluma nitroreducens]|uniref:hypothetical protein n=1 Tax=Aquipluma nitroreducens TaxID=2010828 RepID=UPI00296FF572|nr:hypothetical protein [Aquipluma nitroreducens]